MAPSLICLFVMVEGTICLYVMEEVQFTVEKTQTKERVS